ncbi:MAG TPA: hypothetical protein VFZ27_18580 [Terriglobia bacterium]|nr:hypothetical protein [Terriglobia bacterium]
MNKTYTRRLGSSRRAFLGSVASAGAVLGAGFLSPVSAQAGDGAVPIINEGHQPNPIPGGVAPFKPFAIFIHHNPLKPGTALADINDPSQITDFDGFVGLTHIRGGGTGTDTTSNLSQDLAYQADMGLAQGKYIGADGHQHEGTFAFV